MKNLKHIIIVASFLFLYSCGGEAPKENVPVEKTTETKVKEEVKVEKTVVEETISSEMSIGVGPITKVELGELDEDMAAKGMEVYKAKCTACHKWKKRYIGPALKGISERRTPEWTMNMIINPEEMIIKDAVAKALLAEYSAPMADQGISEVEARAIFEFFRQQDNK